MDPRIPERFISSSSKAKGISMYLASARLVARLTDDYYESVNFLLTEEDRENLLKIIELRQDVKNEVHDIDLYLQNILNRIQQSKH